MKKLLALVCVLGCGGAGWSQGAQDEFLWGCERSGAEDSFCRCALEESMSRWDEEEFTRITNDDLVPVAMECL